MVARPEGAHPLPSEHARGIAGPHQQRLPSRHRLAGAEVLAAAHAEAVRLCELNVLEDVLGSPVRTASHRESGVEKPAERNQVLQDVFPHAFGKEIAFRPGEGHARRYLEPEACVPAGLLFLEQVDVLQDPVALCLRVSRQDCLGPVEKLVVVAVSRADVVEAQTVTGAVLDGPLFLLTRNEGEPSRRFSVGPAVGLVHANEAGPAGASARNGHTVAATEIVGHIGHGQRQLEVVVEFFVRQGLRPWNAVDLRLQGHEHPDREGTLGAEYPVDLHLQGAHGVPLVYGRDPHSVVFAHGVLGPGEGGVGVEKGQVSEEGVHKPVVRVVDIHRASENPGGLPLPVLFDPDVLHTIGRVPGDA